MHACKAQFVPRDAATLRPSGRPLAGSAWAEAPTPQTICPRGHAAGTGWPLRVASGCPAHWQKGVCEASGPVGMQIWARMRRQGSARAASSTHTLGLACCLPRPSAHPRGEWGEGGHTHGGRRWRSHAPGCFAAFATPSYQRARPTPRRVCPHGKEHASLPRRSPPPPRAAPLSAGHSSPRCALTDCCSSSCATSA